MRVFYGDAEQENIEEMYGREYRPALRRVHITVQVLPLSFAAAGLLFGCRFSISARQSSNTLAEGRRDRVRT